MQIIEDKIFDNIDFTKAVFEKAEHESCEFIQCNFLQVDLSKTVFINCTFKNCDLSLAKVYQVLLRDIKFLDCKLSGWQFSDINSFGLSVSFDRCVLTNASFYSTPLKNSKLKDVLLKEVDFTAADLTGTVFDQCDFTNAIFDQTNLEKVDLRTSFNYSIDINKNKVKKSKHSKTGALGLLDSLNVVVE